MSAPRPEAPAADELRAAIEDLRARLARLEAAARTPAAAPGPAAPPPQTAPVPPAMARRRVVTGLRYSSSSDSSAGWTARLVADWEYVWVHLGASSASSNAGSETVVEFVPEEV